MSPTAQEKFQTPEEELQDIRGRVGSKRDLLIKKTDKITGKIKMMEKRVKSIKEVCQYTVKVADSCPLTLDMQREKRDRNGRVNEMENEALRLEKMKKQAFLEKISKEINDKERLNSTKKKAPVTSTTTIDELLRMDEDDKAEV